MRNFRPNIVVKGCNAPYEEDTWKKIVIGEDRENIFYVTCRSIRCTGKFRSAYSLSWSKLVEPGFIRAFWIRCSAQRESGYWRKKWYPAVEDANVVSQGGQRRDLQGLLW